MDEFETFVERIRKYGLLSTSFNGESKSSFILLIDDLPVTNGKAAFGRLKDCLNLLVRTTQMPTAILVTDYGNADSADHNARCLEEIQLSLLRAGACKVTSLKCSLFSFNVLLIEDTYAKLNLVNFQIAFNPITANSIKKVLFRICQLEQCDVTAEHVDLIAKASGGDIRHAITSLQFFCLKQNQNHSLSLFSRSINVSEENENKAVTLDDGYSLHFSRDETLSLFHALGKFLHNKRETKSAAKDGIPPLFKKKSREIEI